MNLIEPSRIIELKARVKAECARRKYVGSVAEYSEAGYDFIETPIVDQKVLEEHYRQLAVPMNAINSNNTPDVIGIDREITEEDFAKMEDYITRYESREIYDTSPTDCSSSCTGTCTVDCTGGCGSGCSGTCRGRCSGSCRGGCRGCSGTCTGGCEGSCISCAGECSSMCSGGCSSNCSVGCRGSCYTSCSAGCDTGCSKSCGSCEGDCQACRGVKSASAWI